MSRKAWEPTVKQTQRKSLLRVCRALAVVGWIWTLESRAGAAQISGFAKKDVAVAARVNGELITRAEVEKLLASPRERQQLLGAPDVEERDSKELDRRALDRLIERRLVLQEAGRRKFTVAEKELDKAVGSLRRRFDDIKGLGVWMHEQGLDDKSLFETARVEMLAARVRAALVQDVRVADDRVQQFYAAHKDDLKMQEVRLQIIVVNDEGAANEIMAALKAGGDFGKLAQQRSVGLRAAQGGDTEWVDVETLWPPMRDAVRTMKPRQARGPLKREAEFLIVRVHERREGRAMTLSEARPHIERRLLPAAQHDAVQAWLTAQKKTAKIEILLQAR
jgi:parvulin-like peptidyl-prolyl isomerase